MTLIEILNLFDCPYTVISQCQSLYENDLLALFIKIGTQILSSDLQLLLYLFFSQSIVILVSRDVCFKTVESD